MSFAANVLKVFIASPGDVAAERKVIRNVVHEWNNIHSEDRGTVLLPVGWETHSTPTMGERPQAIINKQVLANCDILIAVFWTRLGSPTGQSASGTVEEIEEHLAAGKPAMLYFSDAPVRLDSVDDAQYQALRTFRRQCYDRGLVQSYETTEAFKDTFSRQLSQKIIQEFSKPESPVEHSQTAPARPVRHVLSLEAREILLTASEGDGTILQVRSTEGLIIQSGNRVFMEDDSPREAARWRSGLKELLEHDLIEGDDRDSDYFEVTHTGHEVAKDIRKSL